MVGVGLPCRSLWHRILREDRRRVGTCPGHLQTIVEVPASYWTERGDIRVFSPCWMGEEAFHRNQLAVAGVRSLMLAGPAMPPLPQGRTFTGSNLPADQLASVSSGLRSAMRVGDVDLNARLVCLRAMRPQRRSPNTAFHTVRFEAANCWACSSSVQRLPLRRALQPAASTSPLPFRGMKKTPSAIVGCMGGLQRRRCWERHRMIVTLGAVFEARTWSRRTCVAHSSSAPGRTG